jgi:predicted AlkP superfamily phosphohydrolase/phosphomutase
MNKTVVLGLDGATFKLIEPWMEDGSLPNLARIAEEGVKTNLESCKPPVTSQAWKVFSTGLNPGKLGIYWWRQLDRDDFSTISSGGNLHFDKKNMWDYLSEDGQKVGVLGTPLTYPPEEVNGYLVAGGPFASEEDYTYPEDLEDELKEELGYRVRPDINLGDIPTEERYEQGLETVKSKFEGGKYLLEKEDLNFLNITTFFLNAMQHNWWDHDYIKDIWKELDSELEDFMNEDTNLIIISDHGIEPAPRQFYLGSWLAEEGYTKLKEDEDEGRAREKIYHRMRSVATKVDLPEPLISLGGKFFRKIDVERPSNSVTDSSNFESEIDYDESKAVGFPQGNIYLINCEGEEREKLREEIKEKLENLTDNGNKVVEKVYYREDIYSGEYVEKAPDLYVEPAEGYRIRQGEVENVENKEFFTDAPTDGSDWKATNHPDGILMGYGPDISNNSNFEAKLQDIAPTVLHMRGLPIPEEMDGRVLTELFQSDSEVGKRDPEREKINIKKNGFKDDLVQDLDI